MRCCAMMRDGLQYTRISSRSLPLKLITAAPRRVQLLSSDTRALASWTLPLPTTTLAATPAGRRRASPSTFFSLHGIQKHVTFSQGIQPRGLTLYITQDFWNLFGASLSVLGARPLEQRYARYEKAEKGLPVLTLMQMLGPCCLGACYQHLLSSDGSEQRRCKHS